MTEHSIEDVNETPITDEEFEKVEASNLDTIVESDSDDESAVPKWAVIPPDLKIPPGRRVFYLLFKAKWTNTPHKGDRQCVLWSLSDAEENAANERARNNQYRFLKELSKGSIRAVDGLKVNLAQPTSPAYVGTFWNEIGPKCRAVIQSIYLKQSTLTGEDLADFLSNCIAVNSAIPGE